MMWPRSGRTGLLSTLPSILPHLSICHGTWGSRASVILRAHWLMVGRLYLSTPNTPARVPRVLQHSVHIYEWHYDELSSVLSALGLVIEEVIGLLPPPDAVLSDALTRSFGAGAARWHARLREVIPAPFLETVAVAAVPGVASELL